ncbi:Abcc2 [Symbiodinium sp. KB8]|nr:Abcc2 [Symbiodinium sp. KB8]
MENEAYGPRCPRSAFRYDVLFCWLTSMMRRAKGRVVQTTDLCSPPDADLIAEMLPDHVLMVRDVLRRERCSLLQAGVAMLVYSICQTALPIIMLMVIRCVETDDTGELQWLSEWTTVDSMVYWILAYAVFQAGAAVANHWQLHAAFHVGQRVRAQLIMLVFQKALRVDPQRRPSVGHTLTLMASDAQKFLEAMPFIHKLWGSPLQIVLAGAVLVSTISASALCGILVLIAVVPISKNLGKLLQRSRQRHLQFTDQRVRMCVELLEGIRCIKFFAWERPYLERVFQKRQEELYWAMRESLVYGVSMLVTVLAPTFAFATTLVAFALLGEGSFSATRLFGTLALLNALRFPIMDLGSMLASIVALHTGWQRIQHFLDLAEAGIPVARLEDDVELKMERCTFSCNVDGEECFQLSLDATLTLKRGDLCLVLGKVGSGKSTLLQGILGENRCSSGLLSVSHGIAYCAQQPWIRNETLMENILFGEELDSEWYDQVLAACGLGPDLKQLPYGDQTEIGERGVTISGGQKQRVALARAVYQRKCSMVILDDVFSALDAHTSSHIIKALFHGQKGLLRDRAVLLASHQTACALQAQRVLLLGQKDASVPHSSLLFDGDWLDLCKQPHLLSLLGHVLSSDDTVTKEDKQSQEEEENEDAEEAQHRSAAALVTAQTPMPKSMMRSEEHTDRISWRSVKAYCRCCGGFPWVASFFASSVLERIALIFLDWWLARWAEEDSADERSMYFAVYFATVLLVIVFVSFGRLAFAVATVNAGRRLFKQLALSVLRAPMWWWDTTPLGRVLNRFSFDTENTDTTLVTKLFPALQSMSWCWPYLYHCIPCCTSLPVTLNCLRFAPRPLASSWSNPFLHSFFLLHLFR